jgi:hypothetical protein
MTTTNDIKGYVEALIEACNAYYEQVMLSLVFSEEDSQPKLYATGQALNGLSSYLSSKNPGLLESLIQDFKSLEQAELSTLSGNKVSVQGFMDTHYRTIMHLRACLEEENESSDLDADLNLKKWQYAEKDFNGEMERFERDGQSFCLCLLRSDAVWTKDVSDPLLALKPISQGVTSNLRSFDEAYRFSDDYIFVSLKHTDVSGGVKFFERLLRYFEGKEEGIPLGVSGCLTSPVSGQKFDALIQDLRKDLDETCKDSRSDYVVMSEATDLQKFLGND